jgi:hypothetical protein
MHPETFGKGFAFWHMMQAGRIEDERTIDPDRCRRLLWIAWIIQRASENDPQVRIFPQEKRGNDQTWALWLHEHDHVVIVSERTGYYLLKTAFVVLPHKKKELERDWQKADAAGAATSKRPKPPSCEGGF